MKKDLPKWEDNRLNGWIFTNIDGMWYATTRDNYFALFNGENSNKDVAKVVKSNDILLLEDIIIKQNNL